MVGQGSIFLYLEYLLGVNIKNAKSIKWTTSKLRDGYMYCKSQSWSFRVHFKDMHVLWNPYWIISIVIVTMDEEGLVFYNVL